MRHFDFIVLGGGSAGYAAARTAREFSDSVAIVDGSARLSGLCILRGCMPSKTLIHTAEVLHQARHADRLGLRIPTAEPDMPAVIARKNRIIAEFADYRSGQLTSDRFTLFRQHGRFSGPRSLELSDGTTLDADHIVIATGSTVSWPEIPGLQGSAALTSDDILELDRVPESVIVLGGGTVACELAQYLSRIGSRVIQIQRSPRILKEESAAAAETVAQAFRDEGIELFTDTGLESVTASAEGASVRFRHGPDLVERSAEVLFNALGRNPAIDNLNLDLAGVELTKGGQIATDGFQQTSNPAVYAAGDCAGPHEIVHLAIRQGEIAARHAFGKQPPPISYHDLMTVTFTDPQVAAVGLSDAAVRERGDAVAVADYPFNDHGKSILMEANYGFVRCYAERETGRLLRAECVGKDAGELIHALAYPVATRAHVRDIAYRTPWYHPTLAEIWSYPLEDLAGEVS